MKTIIGILTIVSFCFGAYFFIDRNYAKAGDVKEIEQRLDYKILSDQLMFKQQRIWQLQDRYPKGASPPELVNQEMRQLEIDKVDLERKIETIEAK